MGFRSTLNAGPVTVTEYRCEIAPGTRPFVECHGGYSVSYVLKGSFGCITRGRSHELVAGSVMIGFPGQEVVCTHDHAHGDECLSIRLAPELVSRIEDRPAIWQRGALPPLPELVVLGERLQACVDGTSDLGVDEAALLLAARFVELASGTARRADRVRPTGAVRWTPRSGSMRTRTSRSTSRSSRRGPGSASSIFCGCLPRSSARRRTSTWCAPVCVRPRGCLPTATARLLTSRAT